MNRDNDAFAMTCFGKNVVAAINANELPVMTLKYANKIFSIYLLHEAWLSSG